MVMRTTRLVTTLAGRQTLVQRGMMMHMKQVVQAVSKYANSTVDCQKQYGRYRPTMKTTEHHSFMVGAGMPAGKQSLDFNTIFTGHLHETSSHITPAG